MDGRRAWNGFLLGIGVFMASFGVMNFAELVFGWKDRHEQFQRYLSKTVASAFDFDAQSAVTPVLWTVKSVELVLGLVALVAVAAAIRGNAERATRWLALSIAGWMVEFTAMTMMDVWAADRVELQEHTLYFVGFAMLLLVIVGTRLAHRLSALLPDLEALKDEKRDPQAGPRTVPRQGLAPASRSAQSH